MFDLSSLFATGTATIEIRHPKTGEVLMDDSKTPAPWSITALGAHTNEYKALQRKAMYNVHKRNGKVNVDVEKMSVDEFVAAASLSDNDLLELRASAITACNIYDEAGAKIACNKENMVKLLSDERLYWLKNQYFAEVDEGQVFFKG